MSVIFSGHYTELTGDALASWNERWPNFSPREISCRGNDKSMRAEAGLLWIDEGSMKALDMLQDLRNWRKAPLNVTSAYRTPVYNRFVGGAKKSDHLVTCGFDVAMDSHDPAVIEEMARRLGFNAFGHYPAKGFMHIGLRKTPARWNVGGWFKTSPIGLPVQPPARKIDVGDALGGGVAAAGGAAAFKDRIFAYLGGLDSDTLLVALLVGVTAYFISRIISNWRPRYD